MSPATWRIDVDRVVVTGAATTDLDTSHLHDLVIEAIATGLAEATLPGGRTVRGEVQVDAGPFGRNAPAVARAVGSGVVAAIDGAGRHG